MTRWTRATGLALAELLVATAVGLVVSGALMALVPAGRRRSPDAARSRRRGPTPP